MEDQESIISFFSVYERSILYRMCLAGEYEHCNTSHVCRIQLEPNYSWLDPVFLFLGLPPHSGSSQSASQPFAASAFSSSTDCRVHLKQIAGGIWADTVGGKLVLGFGVVWWSVATALTPIAAKVGLPFLLVVRAFMGVGEVSSFIHVTSSSWDKQDHLHISILFECAIEHFQLFLQGVAMPAMNNILSKWVPVSERSRSLALVYSGMYLGSVTGLAFSPFLIHQFGWPSVFYSFGSLGTVWFAVWLNKVSCHWPCAIFTSSISNTGVLVNCRKFLPAALILFF